MEEATKLEDVLLTLMSALAEFEKTPHPCKALIANTIDGVSNAITHTKQLEVENQLLKEALRKSGAE